MRAYRRRSAQASVTEAKEAQRLIASLKDENEKLRRHLNKEAPKPSRQSKKSRFPIAVRAGLWESIQSATSLRPGTVIQSYASEIPYVVLDKVNRTLYVQNLKNGEIGTLPSLVAKARWRRNSEVQFPKLAEEWKLNRNVT